jgi:Zn-dependent protease
MSIDFDTGRSGAWEPGRPAHAEPPACEPPFPAAPAPTKPPSPFKRARGAIVGALAVIVGAASKLKGVLLLLPKLKLLTTSGSMLVSIGAYALIWRWQFAVGIVLLLFAHEMGHVIQLRREGVPASAPMFIPFLGAVVGMKRLPDDAAAEARVGLAGPVLGSIACLIPLALYGATGNHLFQALAFTGFFLNLFNLAPVLPLDGGRAMAALSPRMWLVGFALLLAFGIAFPNPVVILILVLGGLETWRRFRNRGETSYYRVAPRTRILIAAVYVGLAITLVAAMDATHLTRVFSDA